MGMLCKWISCCEVGIEEMYVVCMACGVEEFVNWSLVLT